MATEKNISSRIINKHDTEANWNKAINFIPKAGEIIIYDKDNNFNYSRIKIGDGVTNINSLAFQEQSTAIIDVAVLPTEDIDEDVLYRLVSGTIIENSGDTVSEWSVIVVDGLPEIGEPVTNDMVNIVAYLNVQDNEGYGYIDANLEATIGVPIGWYGLGELAPSFGVEYGGTIFDIPQTDDESITLNLLVKYALYQHKNKWQSVQGIGNSGTGFMAETFNSFRNKADGKYSHAEGYWTSATAYASHAEGSETAAFGDGSHAEGLLSSAAGIASHAEGEDCAANGHSSHAEGNFSRASGRSSHAEGYSSQAEGDYSHAEGYSAYAKGDYQHVQGKYNIPDTNSLHIVGNGTDSGDSNAHTLDWDGNAWYAGDVYIGSTSGTNKDEGSKILATQEYVDIRVPAWTEADEGKFLQIINGTPAWVSIPSAEEATFGALINFTIEDTPYQAEEGMTWAEWIETLYNIDEYRINNNDICSNNTSEIVIDSNHNSQKPSDIILNSEAYRLSYTGLEDNPFI